MMTTVTIQIGNSDDKLTQAEWGRYVKDVERAINYHCPDVHFFGGSPNWFPWQNVAWVTNAPKDDLMRLLMRLREIREQYGQDSIAWTQGETVFI